MFEIRIYLGFEYWGLEILGVLWVLQNILKKRKMKFWM
jgi:hypothetical protein